MKLRTLLITLSLLLITTFNVNAEEDVIIESPDVKIVIDGQVGTYDDVPLIVNNRTMLPLRAVLTNLGVANDDEHIIWNNEERSVTVVTDTQTIWLQVDNATALVNDEAIQLDVAPMIYSDNNRTYIPARFVSESLGKKVVWDGSTTTVLITDTDRHNEILAILEASNSVDLSENYAFDIDYDLAMTSDGVQSEAQMEIIMMLNTQQNAMYIDMDMLMTEDISIDAEEQEPGIFSIEMYQLPDFTYMSMSFFGDMWMKAPTEDDLETTIENSDTIDMETFALEANDIVAAGLVIVDNPDEDFIHLKGNVYMEDMLADSLDMLDSGVDPSTVTIRDYYLDMTLARESYEFVGMLITTDMSVVDVDGQTIDILADITLTYDILEEGYEIVVPEEVLNNAVEF